MTVTVNGTGDMWVPKVSSVDLTPDLTWVQLMRFLIPPLRKASVNSVGCQCQLSFACACSHLTESRVVHCKDCVLPQANYN